MKTTSSAGESGSPPSNHRQFALGVDGGGTKTTAWIGNSNEQGDADILGRANAGSSNQVAVGVDVAFENLAKAVQNACSEAQISTDQLAAGVFALAGSGNEDARQRILEFVEQRLQLADAQVIHDGQAVLEAATPDGWGIALIAGTGAVAYGKNRAGETAVVGGWGYWFGDEGSAYWLGQQALRAIAKASDGRAPQTQLTNSVLGRVGIDDPREILSAMARQGEIRSMIASLADLVCESAGQQDAAASSILDDAARHWIEHIATLSRRLAIDEEVPLAIAGGVLCGSEIARVRLQQQLEAKQLAVTACEMVQEPVLGCVKLAMRTLETQN